MTLRSIANRSRIAVCLLFPVFAFGSTSDDPCKKAWSEDCCSPSRLQANGACYECFGATTPCCPYIFDINGTHWYLLNASPSDPEATPESYFPPESSTCKYHHVACEGITCVSQPSTQTFYCIGVGRPEVDVECP